MKRYYELDSLRGLAALSVLIVHYLDVMGREAIPAYLKLSPLRVLWAGNEAVILFFVLSGFVLTLPYTNGKKMVYKSFIIKRIFRIYLPYLIAVVVSIILFILFGNEITDKIYGSWNINLSWNLCLQHLLLIGNFNTSSYDLVIWSLVHEMRVSLFFPLILWLTLKHNWKISVCASILFWIVSGTNDVYNFDVSMGYQTSFIHTLHYLPMFIVGSLIARYKEEILDKTKNLNANIRLLLLLFGLFCYNYAQVFFYVITAKWNFEVIDTVILFGVMIIIISSISWENVSSVLLKKPFLFLGKVSYSLYLYHVPVLLTFVCLFYGKIPLIFIFLISFIITLIFSTVAWRYIEKTSTKLGKRLTEVDNGYEKISKVS